MGRITKSKRDFLSATFRPAVVSTQQHTESDHTVVYVGVCMYVRACVLVCVYICVCVRACVCKTSPEHEVDGNPA
jgi:hypothetical protein